MTPNGTLFLKRSEIAGLLTFSDYVRAVENAFRAHAEGKSIAPGLLHIDGIDGEFHIKAGGLLAEAPRFAAKINGGFFQNRARFGLPNIQGVIFLCDAANGYPLCVMDSIEITLQRTGAATAVAAKYLARPESTVATLCGLGNQGRIQLQAIVSALPIRTVYAWSPFAGEAETFARTVQTDSAVTVLPTADLEQSVRHSDVVITCTPSRAAFLMKSAVRSGTFVAAVGADSPEKQEIDTALLASSKVVADLIDQVIRVGDTHHAIEHGLMNRQDIHGEIGEIIAGHKPGRTSNEEIVIYDATGSALQDAAAAVAIYAAARKAGAGTLIDLAA